jgi:hypothetical protein
MKTLLLAFVATVGLVAGAAHAVPIAPGSTLSLTGQDSFTQISITFNGAANVGATTGSFTELAACTGCVTMIATLDAGSGGNLYSVADGVDSSALAITPPSTFIFTPNANPALDALEVTGTGTLTLTGFDPTPGTFVITTQGPTQSSVTFSATSTPTVTADEPAAMGTFGVALVLTGWLYQRRRQH